MKQVNFDDFMRQVKESDMIPVAVIGYKVVSSHGLDGKEKVEVVGAFVEHPHVKKSKQMQKVVLDVIKTMKTNWKNFGGVKFIS